MRRPAHLLDLLSQLTGGGQHQTLALLQVVVQVLHSRRSRHNRRSALELGYKMGGQQSQAGGAGGPQQPQPTFAAPGPLAARAVLRAVGLPLLPTER